MSKPRIFDDIEAVSLYNLNDIFNGFGVGSGNSFVKICDQFSKIITSFHSESLDISEPICSEFLRSTFPRFLEVLIRRKTGHEHALTVFSVLKSAVVLLANQNFQNFSELVELRNILLGAANNSLTFLTQEDVHPKDIQPTSNQHSGPNHFSIGSSYFGQHGQASMVYGKNLTPIYFWPDEWEKTVGKEKAIGHFISIYNRNLNNWRHGQVMEYDEKSGLHTVRYDMNDSQNRPQTQEYQGKSFEYEIENYVIDKINIANVPHNWVDSAYKHKFHSDSLAPASSPNRSKPYDNQQELQKLSFSYHDQGKFVRIWWSRYMKFFYGSIIKYDTPTKQHLIIYEDGDSKSYDMTVRVFEVVTPPDTLQSVLQQCKTSSEAAAIVSNWHQSYIMNQCSPPHPVTAATDHHGTQSEALKTGTTPGDRLPLAKPSTSVQGPTGGAPQGLALVTDGTGSGGEGGQHRVSVAADVAVRPEPSLGYSSSIYLLDLVNLFQKERGFEHMFRVQETGLLPSPHILLLNIKLISSLRPRICTPFFHELVWNYKEVLPTIVSKYEDVHLKDVTKEIIHDILITLRELLHIVTNYANLQEVNLNLEKLHLYLALKLLNCNILQKRYFGLSILKDTIEIVYPRIHTYVPAPSRSFTPRGDVSSVASRISRNVVWDPKDLMGWLLEHQVVDCIFGSSLHQDLAAKSDLILIFLALKGGLSEDHLDAIWQSSIGGHEAVVRVLHHLILLLVPFLNPSLRQHLFFLFATVPFSEMSEQMLLLLKNFTLQSSKSVIQDYSASTIITSQNNNNNNIAVVGMVSSVTMKPLLGLGILWSYIQDPESGSSASDGTEQTSIDENKVDLAVQYIVDLLTEEFKEDREDFMQRCVDNILSGNSVPVSLKVLRMILALYPTASKSWFGVGRSNNKQSTPSSHIDRLQRQNRLLEAFFKDLARYQSLFAEQTGASGAGGAVNGAETPSVPSITSLNALSYNAQNSKLNFGAEDGASPLPTRQGTPVFIRRNNRSFTDMQAAEGGAVGFPSLQAASSNTSHPSTPTSATMRRNKNSFLNYSDITLSLNDKRLRLNGKIFRSSHLRGIKERLEFLKFVVCSSSSCTLNESQTFLLWNFLVESAPTVDTIDVFVDWLDSLLNTEGKSFGTFISNLTRENDMMAFNDSSTSKLSFLLPKFDLNANDIDWTPSFDDGVLLTLFEEKMFPWAMKFENRSILSRPLVAAMFLKLFLWVNVMNKSIKIESEGSSWTRVGQLTGSNLVWLMCCEVDDGLVAQGAVSLLVELHYRLSSRIKGGADQTRIYFLKRCFAHMSLSIQTLREKEAANSNSSPLVSHHVYHTSLVGSGDARGEDVHDSVPTITASGGLVVGGNNSSARRISNADQQGNQAHAAIAASSSTNQELDDVSWDKDRIKLEEPTVILRQVTRSVMLMRLFIQRLSQKPTNSLSVHLSPPIGVSVSSSQGSSSPAFTELVLRGSDTLGVLRDRVAGMLNQHQEDVQLFREVVVRNGTSFYGGVLIETLEKNYQTLRELKIKSKSVIFWKSKESGATNKPAHMKDPNSTHGQLNVPDVITPRDVAQSVLSSMTMSSNLSTFQNSVEIYPFDWVLPISVLSSVSDPNELVYHLFGDISFPLQPHEDMVLLVDKIAKKAVNTKIASVLDMDGASLAEYLGPYLKKRPEHFDQLFEMLDGYLSVEIQGTIVGGSSREGSGGDISSAVWEVIQSLPSHPDLLRKFRDLQNDHLNNSGSGKVVPRISIFSSQPAVTLSTTSNQSPSSFSFRKVLDPSCPYRLLYSLQIIDSFIGGLPAPQSNVEDSSSGTSDPYVRATREWCLKFIHLGGVEYLLELLDTLMDMERRGLLYRNNNSSSSDLPSHQTNSLQKTVAKKSGDDDAPSHSVSRTDAFILIIAILLRILHRLLCLDPKYELWQRLPVQPSASTAAPSQQNSVPATPSSANSTTNTASQIPPNMLMMLIDLEKFTQNVIYCVFQVASMLAHGVVAAVAMQALTEHALQLVLGLAMATDNGAKMLSTCCNLEKWLRTMALRNPIQSLRQGVCRRIIEISALIISRCADPAIPDREKHCRRELFHLLFMTTIICAYPTLKTQYHKSPSDSNNNSTNSNNNNNSPMKKNEGLNRSMKSFFHDYDDGGVKDSKPKRTIESYAYAEELFTTIAILLVFRSRPQFYGSGSFLALESELMNDYTRAGEYWVDENELCHLFVDQLVSHKSSESFHTSKEDGTLIGLLRILVVLSSGSSSMKNLMGSVHIPTSTFNSGNLISFLYRTCLFPDEEIQKVSSKSILNPVRDTEAMGAMCQSSQSRGLTYALICKLCDSDDFLNFSNLMTVMAADVGNHYSTDRSQVYTSICLNKSLLQWGYDPGLLLKAEDTFVGLVNQGATCYMNAFLQQIFHVPNFSRGILALERKSSKYNTDDNNDDYDENTSDSSYANDNEILLFQLQVLFGYLSLSQKRFYDTKPFCLSFKDYDGQPVRMSEQKDINEFGSMLFEKLETNTLCAELLARTFGGKLVWQIISTETDYKSEREEPFYMITAEVKNKESLEDSLELFVTGEMLTGDNKIEDSKTGRKVDALRRCAIRTLPETLIIHLKRFEFDLETLNRKKLNDRITFPMDLNMFPYTEEGVASKEARLRIHDEISPDGDFSDLGSDGVTTDSFGMNGTSGAAIESSNRKGMRHSQRQEEEKSAVKDGADAAYNQDSVDTSGSLERQRFPSYYQYSLKGIVAHVGAIDSGHYYSFIKERKSNRWFEFNDRLVLPFSEESISQECYGGPESVQGISDAEMAKSGMLKQNNAYLLFYERIPDDSSALHSSSPMLGNNMYSPLPPAQAQSKASESTVDPSRSKDVVSDEVDQDFPANAVSNLKEDVEVSLSDQSKSTDDVYLIDDTGDDTSEDGETNLFTSSDANVENVDRRPMIPSIKFAPKRDEARPPAITRSVLQAIWLENMAFLRDRNLFHSSYFKFIWFIENCPVIQKMNGESDFENDEVKRSMLANSEYGNLRTKILSQLGVTLLRFHIEILSHARALSCTVLFFDKLEDIVHLDDSGVMADVILQELSKDSSYVKFLSSKSTSPSASSLEIASKGNSHIHLVSSTPSQLSPNMHRQNSKGSVIIHSKYCSRERSYMEENCHRWLLEIYISCPHTVAMESFSRLLFSCLRKLRAVQGTKYLTIKHPTRPRGSSSAGNNSGMERPRGRSVSSANNENDGRDKGAQSVESIRHEPSLEIYISNIPRLLNKILIIMENMRFEDISNRDGYRFLSSLLFNFASIGHAERGLLLHLGAVSRLSLGLIALHPHIHKIPTTSLTYATQTISMIVRSAAFPIVDTSSASSNHRQQSHTAPSTGSSAAVSSTQGAVKVSPHSLLEGVHQDEIPCVSPDDYSVLQNRILLEDAIITHPECMLSLLRHMCWHNPKSKDTMKLMEFLGEKLMENFAWYATQSNEIAVVSPTERPYFKILAGLLLSDAVDTHQACDSSFPGVLRKAESFLSRSSSTNKVDTLELVYALFKLLLQVGCSSASGQSYVIRIRELWNNLRSKVRLSYR